MLDRELFDVAVIGAGAVGSAIARQLSQYRLKIALLDSNPDVGMGTSKASTAIWHTGFDAAPGSLEARLIHRSYGLMEKFMPQANIAHERLGALLVAWNDEQLDALPGLLDGARANSVPDLERIAADEVYRREPNLRPGALGALFIPREGILCTYSVPLACAYQAVRDGTKLFLNFRVLEVHDEGGAWKLVGESGEVRARFAVNAAGLFADEINALFGRGGFSVRPRRGQLIVFDKLARPLIRHILLPVPTGKTKGMLITPTVYGNILLGPTAEDLEDKAARQTTEDGLHLLMQTGIEILPALAHEEVTATYSGLRAATEHRDYQIEMYADQRYLCVAGIRSTGISAAFGIAEYAQELLSGAGLELHRKPDSASMRMPTIGQAGVRPYQDESMIARDAAYGEIVCHCERVSRGEIRDALQATIPARSLDALRRRTRAMQGRCQGFNCHAALTKAVEEAAKYDAKTTARSTYLPAEAQNASGGLHSAREVDVLIVGAGPAGLAAAIELKRLGIRDVLVADRELEAGGMPRFCHHTGFGREDLWRIMSGPRYAQYYRERAGRVDVEVKTSTTITAWESGTRTDELRLSYSSPHGLGSIRARAVLLATGVRERPRAARLVPGTRPQGIFTTGSLQRFVYQEHLPVGARAVIVGAELISLSALLTLLHAGVKCEALITEHARDQIYFPFSPIKWLLADAIAHAPLLTNSRLTNILGSPRVTAVVIERADGGRQTVACDSVIFTGDWIPEHELARLGGLSIAAGSRGPQIDSEYRTSRAGVFAAGNLLRGVATADACALEGQGAANAIAHYLRNPVWPKSGVEIRAQEPLKWISPNFLWEPAATRFRFEAQSFSRNMELIIMQSARTLVKKRVPRVVVNDFMFVDSAWTNQIDFSGEPLVASLVPA